MRKIIVSEFVTLDNVMEAPNEWSFQFWNEEAAKYKLEELFASDALLLGRVTYQLFADAWSSMTDEENMKIVKEAGGDVEALKLSTDNKNPFSDRMNSIPKFVVSTTLEKADWNNSKLIKENIKEEISKLKQQPGQDILVEGSGNLVDTLMRYDQIDEYRIMVFPIVLGSGKRLFKDGSYKKFLKLVDVKIFRSGVVVLSYKPAEKKE